MSDKFKKLTGKNPKEFQPVAFDVINIPDIELFQELVEKDDFLFDFVKQNVAKRLSENCNEKNYLNLLELLKFYSPSYEEFIVSALADFADEDLTDKMLDIFENGTDNEKTYCAKFFSYIQDPLSIELLRKNAYSENPALSTNCASTLGVMADNVSYNQALEKLQNSDDFTCLDGVKFLCCYGDKNAVPAIIEVMKKSSMAENIAGELPYLCNLFDLYELNAKDCLYVVNTILSGLGEILGLSQIFDFCLYDFLDMLLKNNLTPEIAIVLSEAKEKFETLTENDEYLFDEDKNTKQEVLDIKNLLSSVNTEKLQNLTDIELNENSLFCYSALDLTKNKTKVRELINSNNPTIILKSIEILKSMNNLTEQDKQIALANLKEDNLKNIVRAL